LISRFDAQARQSERRGGKRVGFGRCDIHEPSEAFRHKMDYLSHTRNARAMLEGLAALQPTTLACMQGSAWRGDGAALLRALADSVEHGGARQN